MSETTLKRAVLDGIHAMGVWAISVPSGKLRKGRSFIQLAPTGTADILVRIPPRGRMGWIETKDGAAGDKATKKARAEAQAAFGAKCVRDGAFYTKALTVDEALGAVRGWLATERGEA